MALAVIFMYRSLDLMADGGRRMHSEADSGRFELNVDDLIDGEVEADLLIDVDQSACALELVEDDGAGYATTVV